MSKKVSGNIHFGVIFEHQKNGDIYVYQRKTTYDPNLQYSTSLGKKLLGKIENGTTSVVNTRYKKKSQSFQQANSNDPIASKSHVGMIDIVEFIAKESSISNQLMHAIPYDIGLRQKVETLAWYKFATDGETWPGIISWSVRYRGLLPYKDTSISQDMYHDVFSYLGTHEEIKQAIFLRRAADLSKGELLALDSTTISTEAKRINSSRMAPHKDGIVKNVYKIVQIYSISSRQPIAYSLIPGNIPDISTIPNALKQLEALHIENIEIISDNGYCSESNLLCLANSGYRFITRITTNIQWISTLIDKNRDKLYLSGEVMHCDPNYVGITVRVNHAFSQITQPEDSECDDKENNKKIIKRLYVHIYYSSLKKGTEDSKFQKRFDEIRTDLRANVKLSTDELAFAKKYMIIQRSGTEVTDVKINYDEYCKLSKYHGFLVLVARTENNANNALIKFRKREYVEEDIKNGKTHTGTRTPRVYTDDTLDGELLIQQLAMSMHDCFETKVCMMKNHLAEPTGQYLHDRQEILNLEKALKNWLRKTSLHGILQWFDAIVETKMNGKRWHTEMSKRDLLFLEKLGMQSTDD